MTEARQSTTAVIASKAWQSMTSCVKMDRHLVPPHDDDSVIAIAASRHVATLLAAKGGSSL